MHLANAFDANRDRSRGAAVDPLPDIGSPTHWIDQAIGPRYERCTLGNFQTSFEGQRVAVEQCRDYVANFPRYASEGRNLLFIGPKGTGKDHLMVAVVREICNRMPPRQSGARRRVVYRDGLVLFSEFRSMISSRKNEDKLIEGYAEPHLLALSDPLPPAGSLSDYERRMMHRVIDARYRQLRPTTATINVANRAELDSRMTPQTSDRLCDFAIVVSCNWESYRQRKVTK